MKEKNGGNNMGKTNFIVSDSNSIIVEAPFRHSQFAPNVQSIDYYAGDIYPSNDIHALGIVTENISISRKDEKVTIIDSRINIDTPTYPFVKVLRAGKVNADLLPHAPTKEAMEVLNIDFVISDMTPYTNEGIEVYEHFEKKGFDCKKHGVAEYKGKKYVIEDCTLYDETMETLIYFCPVRTGTFKVPNSVKTIGYRAFNDTDLDEIILNRGVKRISNQAFINFDNSTHSVIIPETIEYIARDAFKNTDYISSMGGNVLNRQRHSKINAKVIINRPKNSIEGHPFGSPFINISWKD